MTAAEYLALPEDGPERMLIAGELWESDTVRPHGFRQAQAVARTATELECWAERQPEPRGAVLILAGVVLDADTAFGIDVTYFSASVMTVQSDEPDAVMVGSPTLAVEVLAPEDIPVWQSTRLAAYRRAKVRLVWLLDPELRTVTAIRPDVSTATFSGTLDVTAQDVLPGFRVPAVDLFG
jgi:Uma2 family endonuclease